MTSIINFEPGLVLDMIAKARPVPPIVRDCPVAYAEDEA
jgi:hypothetical protein